MTDRKPEELSEDDLGQVTGGAGHELSHTVQQNGGHKFIGETEKNLMSGKDAIASGKIGKLQKDGIISADEGETI